MRTIRRVLIRFFLVAMLANFGFQAFSTTKEAEITEDVVVESTTQDEQFDEETEELVDAPEDTAGLALASSNLNTTEDDIIDSDATDSNVTNSNVTDSLSQEIDEIASIEDVEEQVGTDESVQEDTQPVQDEEKSTQADDASSQMDTSAVLTEETPTVLTEETSAEPDTQQTEEASDITGEYADMLSLINAHRAAAGIEALTWDDTLENDAYQRAQEASIKWSHTRPNGKAWYTAEDVPKTMWAENLAREYYSADTVVDAWMNSPKHRDNLLDPKLHTVAFAVYDAPNGRRYIALEFGI